MNNRPRGREKNITGQGNSVNKRGSGIGSGTVGRPSGSNRSSETNGTNRGMPRGREKNVTGIGNSAERRGDGLDFGGPVGQSNGFQSQSGGNRSTKRSTRSGGSSLLTIIIAAVVLLGGGGGALSGVLGNTSSDDDYYYQSSEESSSSSLSELLGGTYYSGNGYTSSGWKRTANTGKLNTSVSSLARDKRTQIIGDGKDTFTIMVYMCGTDLESSYGMGTNDLQEMLNATISDNVNLLVYTGGCKKWNNNVVSSSANQIYQITSEGLVRLVESDGSKAMVDPSTLTSYIQYCEKNFPANRYGLILWDHGGGSVSGYGYDEKYSNYGSMSLKGIDEALSDAGVNFDFIGFDACLMSTLENALMLSDYADYMIASEETEPGVGWYYTNWLTKLSANTSMKTIEIGKNIIDDFVSVCNQECSGQSTTLSIVDLAELEKTVPDDFVSFASNTADMITQDEYKTVSSARSNSREFASSSKIDQVDLVHLATNIGSDEGEELSQAILEAVKYNKTSSDMTNAYGLSIYFPYQSTSSVSSAVATYEAIGLDDEYSKCIEQFASMETAGQAVSGGSSSPLSSLLGYGYSGTSSSSDVYDILGSLLSGSLSGYSGSSSYLGSFLGTDRAVTYLTNNQFDASQLEWVEGNDGYEIILTEDQWSLVQNLELNVFVDDGEGYIDLGLDNVFEFTEEGNLKGSFDGTWLAIDNQPVAYYMISTYDDGDNYKITGYVPCLLNGVRSELILVFDNDNPYGYIAGSQPVYEDGETETIAKAVTTIEEGTTIDFLCDYYSYDGEYLDSYMMGEQMNYYDGMTISNVYLQESAVASYLFVDIYNQEYWTPSIP